MRVDRPRPGDKRFYLPQASSAENEDRSSKTEEKLQFYRAPGIFRTKFAQSSKRKQSKSAGEKPGRFFLTGVDFKIDGCNVKTSPVACWMMKWESMLGIGRNCESMKNRICLVVVKLFFLLAEYSQMDVDAQRHLPTDGPIVRSCSKNEGSWIVFRCNCSRNIGNKYGERRNIFPRNKNGTLKGVRLLLVAQVRDICMWYGRTHFSWPGF